jgi:hypothetical protein
MKKITNRFVSCTFYPNFSVTLRIRNPDPAILGLGASLDMGGGSKQDGTSHCSVPYPGMHKTRKPKLNRSESMHCSRQCLKNVPVPLYQVEDLTGNCYVRAV